MLKSYKPLLLSLLLASASAQAGYINVLDPVAGQKKIYYTEKNGDALVEGDIILGSVEELHAAGAIIRTKIGGKRWPHGIVPFELAKDLPFTNKLAVFQAIDHLQRHTNLTFVERTHKNRENYSDYIRFRPAEGTTCSSSVGRKGGKQYINLAPRCHTMNSVHEIAHAIGMWHEQSRADRDQHVRIIWQNIEEDSQNNFNQHLGNSKDYGEYDYRSIMHYGAYAFSKNGEKTIIPYDDSVSIGQRVALSDKDIAAINAMYPES